MQQGWELPGNIGAYCPRLGILSCFVSPLCMCSWVRVPHASAAPAPSPAAGCAGTHWGQLPRKAWPAAPAEQHQQSDAKGDLYQLQLWPLRYLTCFPIANYVSIH